MNKILQVTYLCSLLIIVFVLNTQGQDTVVVKKDANNPIDPNPTAALFNRSYGDEKQMTQFIANATFNKWFVRFATEAEFNHRADNLYKGGNLVVSRLFSSKNEVHKFGAGAIVSYLNPKGFGFGANVVTVNPFGQWKFISLTTYQAGNDISLLEFQPGLYLTLENGWYLRSHPRMLFDFAEDYYEVPVGAGAGYIIDVNGTNINFLLEPQYDFSNNRVMLYAGIKALF